MRHIDIVTTAIPRPLLRPAIMSFMRSFIGSRHYRIRWLFHLDQYPGLEDQQNSVMREAVELSDLFAESILIKSHENVGFIEANRKLLGLSKNPVVFVEDDWYWRGRFMLRRIESELKRQGRHAFSFRNPYEYIGAMGCCYWTRQTVNVLVGWQRQDLINTERDVKRLMRHYCLRTLTAPRRKLHDPRPVRHMGPRWAVENGLGRSTRID